MHFFYFNTQYGRMEVNCDNEVNEPTQGDLFDIIIGSKLSRGVTSKKLITTY